MASDRPAGSSPAGSALALLFRDVVAGYHGNQVLQGVTIEVPKGEVVLVLGPNGTGKSTLLSVGSGLVRPKQGAVLLDGRDITGLAAHRRAHMGVAHVPEGRRIFPRQSVRDNLLLGSLAGSKRGSRDEGFEWVYRLFPVLERKRERPAATLSGGEQQMLAIAQAVMAWPRVLLLDEPSAGLAPILAKQVFERVALLKERGISVLMVEQLVGAMTIADRIYVMRNGAVVGQGRPEEFAADTLGSQYLGAAKPA